jgi:hypothetical protein
MINQQIDNLLTSIGEFVSTEIEDVDNVQYLSKEMGDMFVAYMRNGEKVLVSVTSLDE